MIVPEEYEKNFTERRTWIRGFLNITMSLFEDFQKNRPIERVCELGGLGNGGKPEAWKRSSTGNFTETIVDNLGLHRQLPGDAAAESIMRAKAAGANVVIVDDAYTELSRELALETISPYKFDVLVDDAGSTWPNMINSLSIFKDAIAKDDGLYITETPDGNGDTLVNLPYTNPARTIRLREISSNGMVIFDMSNFSNYNSENTRNAGNQIGIYSPNFEIFKDTINEYKDYIIFGRTWVDHLIK